MARNSVFSFSLLLAILSLPGCGTLIDMFNEKLGPVLGVKLQSATPEAPKPAGATGTTGAAGAAAGAAAGSTAGTTGGSAEKTDAPLPDHRQVNAEFVKELFKIVFQREIRSEEEFGRYMNVMDQGGHYEGIYNGLVYSVEYKEKEKGVAPISALKIYADVMAQILLDQKYDPLKVQKPEKPDVPGTAPEDVAPPQPTSAERLALVGEHERDGMTKSTFTLKRRLGEEVLKTIDLKKEYKEKFATWYARFTVFLNRKGVDFGLAQRNKMEEYFHYHWALTADEDRLKWECLNRVHTLINANSK